MCAKTLHWLYPNCYCIVVSPRQDYSQKPDLIQILVGLLNDNSTVVLGAAVATFNRICPNRFDLIHKHIRKLCKMLTSIDEWGQCHVLHLWLKYMRFHFTDPKITKLDSDHQLMLESCKPLLWSRSSAVVLLVFRIFYYCGNDQMVEQAIPSLLRLLHRPVDEKQCVLQTIAHLSKHEPRWFKKSERSFSIFEGEPFAIKCLKLEILENIACSSNVLWILREFKNFSKSPDIPFAQCSIRCWGNLAQKLPDITTETLKHLMEVTKGQQGFRFNLVNLVGEAIIVIRRLLANNKDNVLQTHGPLVRYLLVSYQEFTVPMAKASVFWLINHNIEALSKMALDTLRLGLKHFGDESRIVKLQILNLSMFSLVHQRQLGEKIEFASLAFEYAMKLAYFDPHIDVRDRGRMLQTLHKICIDIPQPSYDTVLNILKGSYAHHVPRLETQQKQWVIGSLSESVASQIVGDLVLIEWSNSVQASAERQVKVIFIDLDL